MAANCRASSGSAPGAMRMMQSASCWWELVPAAVPTQEPCARFLCGAAHPVSQTLATKTHNQTKKEARPGNPRAAHEWRTALCEWLRSSILRIRLIDVRALVGVDRRLQIVGAQGEAR